VLSSPAEQNPSIKPVSASCANFDFVFRQFRCAMATLISCHAGSICCTASRKSTAVPTTALQRRPLLTCRSTQSSFAGQRVLRQSKCSCARVTTSRSAGLSVRAETSYVMIKPDGVQRALVGEIIHRFERKGFTLKALKMFVPSKELAEEHYKDLSSKPFFPKLVDYIISGPVIAMVS